MIKRWGRPQYYIAWQYQVDATILSKSKDDCSTWHRKMKVTTVNVQLIRTTYMYVCTVHVVEDLQEVSPILLVPESVVQELLTECILLNILLQTWPLFPCSSSSPRNGSLLSSLRCQRADQTFGGRAEQSERDFLNARVCIYIYIQVYPPATSLLP